MTTTFRVGVRVTVPFGQYRAQGRIAEAMRPVVASGHQMYKVLVYMDPFEPTPFIFPGESLEEVDLSKETAALLDKSKVIEYLKHGGLISILRSNRAGGRNQPSAWLCLDSLGGVTHTFYPERGLIGGQTVPASAVHDGKVSRPKRDEVRSFLRNLGLEENEAESVLSFVGTSPANGRNGAVAGRP